MYRRVWQNNKIMRFIKWLSVVISRLFEPEEVEVTFSNKGRYTYTKLPETPKGA